MALHQLILLRHGETDWNAQRRMQGHCDVPLNVDGLAQARKVASSIAALEPDVIVSSDLSRAVVTADILAAASGLSPSADPRLRESSLGDWEGLGLEEVMSRWPAEWERWRTTSAHLAPPGGESRIEVAARASAVVEELEAGSAHRALLVTHGGLIAGLTGLLLGLPNPQWSMLVGIGNCHWVVLHRADRRWRLHTYNAGLGGIVLQDGSDQVAGT